MTISPRLLGSMLRLLYPPRSSKEDAKLVEALERNTAATQELSDRAAGVERALANIQDATKGLFAS